MLDKFESLRAPSEKPTPNKCIIECFAEVSGATDKSLNSWGNTFQQRIDSVAPISAPAHT